MKSIYIAGPMTGYPSFNYPLFDKIAAELRKQGWNPKSPAEMDDEETRAEAMASVDGTLVDGQCNGSTWGDFLSRDVKLIADECDAICLLPGWTKSKGARLEAYVAMGCGHELYEWDLGGLVRVRPNWIYMGIKPEETYQ